MAETISDYDQIIGVVELYVDGMRRGDAGPLKEAFHPDARMFGELAGARYDVPIGALFELVDSGPADVDGSYQVRVVSVEQAGDAAAATIVEEGTWGTVDPSSTTSPSSASTGRGRSSPRPSLTPAASLPATEDQRGVVSARLATARSTSAWHASPRGHQQARSRPASSARTSATVKPSSPRSRAAR